MKVFLVVVIIFYLCKFDKYCDMRADYLDKLQVAQLEQRYIRKCDQLDYTVSLFSKEVA